MLEEEVGRTAGIRPPGTRPRRPGGGGGAGLDCCSTPRGLGFGGPWPCSSRSLLHASLLYSTRTSRYTIRLLIYRTKFPC